MTNAERLGAIVARVGSEAKYTIFSDGPKRKVVIHDPVSGDSFGSGMCESVTKALDVLDAKVPTPASTEAKS